MLGLGRQVPKGAEPLAESELLEFDAEKEILGPASKADLPAVEKKAKKPAAPRARRRKKEA